MIIPEQHLRFAIRKVLTERPEGIAAAAGHTNMDVDSDSWFKEKAIDNLKKNKKKNIKKISAGLLEMVSPEQVIEGAPELMSSVMRGAVPTGFGKMQRKMCRKILSNAGLFDIVNRWQDLVVKAVRTQDMKKAREAMGLGQFMRDRYHAQFYKACLALITPDKDLRSTFGKMADSVVAETGKELAIKGGTEGAEAMAKGIAKTGAKGAVAIAGLALMTVDIFQVVRVAQETGKADAVIKELFKAAFMKIGSGGHKLRGNELVMSTEQLKNAIG